MPKKISGSQRELEAVANLPEIQRAEWHLRMAIQILAIEMPLDLAVEIACETLMDMGRCASTEAQLE